MHPVLGLASLELREALSTILAMSNTNQTDALVTDLMARISRLVEAAKKEGRQGALAEVRSLVGGSMGSSGAKPSTKSKPAKKAAKKTKSGKPRKNPWAGLSDKDRLKRVNAIRKGRGLPLKRRL